MSRRVKKDADAVIQYFEAYNLPEFRENDKLKSECRSLHKRLYALMVFACEYKAQHNLIKGSGEEIFYLCLNEALSDLLLSIITWAQGIYKTSKLELRCSIENFIKAILSFNDLHIYEEKRIFLIFEKAYLDNHFNNPIGISKLNTLKSKYGELCAVVHGTVNGESALNALTFLPKYDNRESNEFCYLYFEVTRSILALLYLNFYQEIQYMHPENKQDFLDSVMAVDIKTINELLFISV